MEKEVLVYNNFKIDKCLNSDVQMKGKMIMKRVLEKVMKGTLLTLVLLANMCLIGCNKESTSVVEVKEEVKQETEDTQVMTEEATEEVTEEKRDYLSEIQLAIQEEQYVDAEGLYKEFYEMEHNQDALIGVLNMWISIGNDAKVKEWVQYVKDNCTQPNADLSVLITRAENCMWMITNIEGIDEDDEWFVEYDEQGRIIHTNIHMHDGRLAVYGSDAYSTDYYYEYLEDGRVKQDEGDFTLGSTYYTYDSEDGHLLSYEKYGEEDDYLLVEYSYEGIYGYSENGISYSEKEITYRYHNGEYIDDSCEYVNYSGYKIGVFPISGDYSQQYDREVDNTFDKHGNLIKRYEQGENFYADKWIYAGFEIEYAYCTPEEYFVAKKNNDFSAYAISNYDAYNNQGQSGNVESNTTEANTDDTNTIAIKSVKTSSKLKSQEGKSYAGKNLIDGKLETAWVEGAAGVGKGETITLHLEEKTEVRGLEIWNGYLASVELYDKNGKVNKIMVDFGNGVMAQEEISVLDAIMLGGMDEKDYANFIELDEPVVTDKIIITILDAEAGNKYEDTCISEIKVY